MSAMILTQIYEVSSPAEAAAISELGVDHIGVLVGDGSFPRERSIDEAAKILSAIKRPAKGSVLSLTADVQLIRRIVLNLRPDILHLGASTDILTPAHVLELRKEFSGLTIMRSIPVSGPDSLALARSYEGLADFLLLDSYSAGDKQIGALGTTHSWDLDKAIIQSVSMPVIIAGGLGPENVADAIRATRPAGVDSKTKTDKDDGSHTKDLVKVKLFAAIAKLTA
jgi:phosphoribosylanthranilate isomerase